MSEQRPAHLSVVITAWNCWAATQACLRSLRRHTPGAFYEVILVDNGSTDATPAEAPLLGEALFPGRFRFLRQERNLNFGPGSNLGAAQASGELLFFLNNDTECTPGWSTPLLQEAKQLPRWGALAPLLVYPSDDGEAARVQHLGVVFAPDLMLQHLYARFPATHPVVRRRRRLQALTGAALLVERRTFTACGGFYPDYANGYEDLDLCCQVRRKGRSLHCVPQSVIVHHEGLTPGRLDNETANAALLQQRCGGCFLPDMHELAAQDGYELRLTPWLSPRLCLPQEREEALTRELAAADAAELRQALEREPLWEGGRERLAQLAVSQQEALSLLDELCFFHPTLARLQAYVTLARELNAPQWERAQLRLETAKSALADPAALRCKVEALRQWAARAHDARLVQVLEA